MAFEIKTRQEILQNMIAAYVASGNDVNDFAPGSTIRSMMEAFASALEETYAQMFLGFRRALDAVPQEVFGLRRKEGIRARVQVTFTKEAAANSSVVVVPADTQVSNGSDLVFSTDSRLVIASGTAAGTVFATAESTGRRYNVAQNTLTTVQDVVSDIASVTNIDAASGGEDRETEPDYNFRFNRYVEGLARSNRAGLEAAALSVVGVSDAKAVDLVPPQSNVNCVLFVDNGTTVGVALAVRQSVLAVVNGDGTASNPGYRSAGVNVRVSSPSISQVSFSITMQISNAYEIASMNTLVEQRLRGFINSTRIGEGTTRSEVIAFIMLIRGVVNVTLAANPNDSALSASNNSVIRLGTVSFTTTRVAV